ncbi:hypothetical protein KSP40_PGU018712 [Platanthera guangdongensis]|uniref:Uncharacterized protein n=1 Tax=Platanthera guangdongensis TaxID=2320717 RepID=A0ABR2MT88_9ASPA
MADAKPKVTIKLFIDARNNKVLFAEAGRDFIDFRLRTFLHLLCDVMKDDAFFRSMLGSIPKLHESVKKLDNIEISKRPVISTSSGYIENSGSGNGREASTYMITDDLEIRPMPAISSIMKKDVQLVEKTVVIDLMEVN